MPTIDTNFRPLPVTPAPTPTPTAVDLPSTEPFEPEDPMIANNRHDLPRLLVDRMNGIVGEFGPTAISRKNLRDRTFTFAEDTAFGIRLEERAYEAKDPFVQDCPVRKAVAENMQANGGGHKVSFIESAGLTEIQGGFMNTMPLVSSPFAGLAMNYGFTVNALLRYRACIPKLLGFGDRPQTNFKDQNVAFYPTNAEKALEMKPGSEYEITGNARLLVNATVGARLGVGFNPASGGLGIIVNGTTTTEKETSLNVLALDRPGMVRVSLRHVDEETAQILSRINLGVLFGAGSLVPNIVGGFLRYYVERMGAPNFETLLQFYTTLYTTFASRVAHRGVGIGSWDLNLNTSQGREAYEQLIRMNTVRAEELAHQGDPAVTDVHFKENEEEFRFFADVGGLGLKFLIYESLKIEREGRLSETSGKTMVYRDSLYTVNKKSIFGQKRIDWEAVKIDDGESHGKEPFLRVHFENKDWDFGTGSVDRMLRFAEALHLPKAEITGDDQERFKKARLDLTKRAEVLVSSDVYFTTKGVDLIDNADAAQGRDAYLKVSATIHKHLHGMDFTATDPVTVEARRRIDEFRALGTWERIQKSPVLYEEYRELTGRRLSDDIKLINEAEAFGAAIDKMHSSTKSREEVAAFIDFAHSKGFDYMQTVAALATLAGEQETLVNALSISSGGIVIKQLSEGGIEGPRERVIDELYRVADPLA